MQIDKRWHVLDAENGRLIKGFDTRALADIHASELAMQNQTKMFVVVEALQLFRVKTEVELLVPSDFKPTEGEE